MKKLMLMVGVMLMTVVVFGAGIPWDATTGAKMQSLISAKDYAGVRAYLATLDMTVSQDAKFSYTALQMSLDNWAGIKATTIDEAKAKVKVYAGNAGYTDQVGIDRVTLGCAYWGNVDRQAVYDYYKSVAGNIKDNPTVVRICIEAKKYADAYAVAGDNYLLASTIAIAEKDDVKYFNYSKKALLSQNCTVVQVTEILTRLWSIDFSDTTVTDEMQYKFLCTVNKKYSQMLVTDKANWETIITQVQTAISALKLQMGK